MSQIPAAIRITLSLTDAGRFYLDERRSRKSAYLSAMLRGLPSEDVEVLTRAAEILDRARPEAPGVPAAGQGDGT